MESISAVAALSALAHEARLNVFRLLVRAGSEGIAAGDIARAIGAPQVCTPLAEIAARAACCPPSQGGTA